MKNFYYRVKAGDTATSISQNFFVPLKDLILLNRLTSEVEEGDLLYLTPTDKAYIVKATDTADSLCKEWGEKSEDLLDRAGFPYLFFGLVIKK